VDPIHPIAPGPPSVSPATRPVAPLERITRERDRPSRDRQQRRRPQPPPAPERDADDDGRPHVDVRV